MVQPNYSDYMQGLEEEQPNGLQKTAGVLRSVGHKMSLIFPFNLLSLVGVPAMLTGLAAGLETLSELTKGKIWGGVKEAAAGTVDTATTFAMGWPMFLAGAPVFWLASVFTGIATGNSLQEVMRNGTKSLLNQMDGSDKAKQNQVDALTEYARSNRVLGMNPQVTAMNTAAVGYAPWVQQQQMMVPAAMAPAGYPGSNVPPNHWQETIARQEGVDPRARQARWMSGAENRENYQQLVAARREAELQSQLQGR